jgi:ribosomal protein S30
MLKVGIVGPCFQKQNGPSGGFGKPTRQNCPGGAGADDYYIIFHDKPLALRSNIPKYDTKSKNGRQPRLRFIREYPGSGEKVALDYLPVTSALQARHPSEMLVHFEVTGNDQQPFPLRLVE